MPMTVKERDQYENLKADWPVYDCSYDPDREHPFRAVPLADRNTELAADSPAELRALVRADHAARIQGTGR
ncbi:MAG: hypothetical protein FWE35_00050 [Streptosporangiales bacterium]|nr:hypothetical protein [Streptosporangiales bacterium]